MKDIKKNPTLAISIIAIIAAAFGFFGGMKYQQTKTPSFARNGMQGTMGQNRQTGGTSATKGTRTGMGAGNNLRVGTISAMDATSITLKMQDGSSKIVILAGSTTYKKTAEASKTDVKVGDTVVITGAANSDGSITAENVQLNPSMIGAGAPPANNAAGAPPEAPQN